MGGVDSAIELMEGAMGENGRGLSLGIFWRVALAVAMPKWLIYNEEGVEIILHEMGQWWMHLTRVWIWYWIRGLKKFCRSLVM